MKLIQREGRKKVTTEMLVYLMYAVMMVGILAVCLFLPHILYARKRVMVSNLLLLPCALATLALCMPLAGKLNVLKKKGGIAALIAVSFGFLLVQIYAVRNYYFYTDWDVETIAESALSFVYGTDITRHGNYFSMCQNNLVLVMLYGWVAKFASFLGMKENVYFSLLIFQCILSWATLLLTCRLIYTLTKSDTAVLLGSAFYVLLAGISPWVSIPYSDSVGIIFPVLLLTVWMTMPAAGMLGMIRAFLMLFLAYFGYRMKPQILIVLMAIALVRIGGWLFPVKEGRRRISLRGREALAACVGLLCAVLLCNSMAAEVKKRVPINEEKQLGMMHYLMLGMNEEEFGVFATRDVSYSWRFETREERAAGNLQVTLERIQNMGPVGLCKQFIRKTLTNYNDGTFCWAGEGAFYREILPESGKASSFFRNVYYGPPEVYQGEYGKYYGLWQNGVQAVWMLVILLSIFSAFGKKDERLAIIMLTLIGLTIFETVFEARARYLYAFLPLYIVLAVQGAGELCRLKESFFRKRTMKN